MRSHFNLTEIVADFQEGGVTTHYMVEHVDETGRPLVIAKTLLIKDGVHIVYTQSSCFLGMKPHMNYKGSYGRKSVMMDTSDMWSATADMTNDEAREFFYSFIDIERGDTAGGRNNIDGTHWCDYKGKKVIA